jgi:hypothetical protein
MVTICPTCFNNQYHFVFIGFVWFSVYSENHISLNSINHLIFVTVKCGVFFEVRIEFLNIIQTSFGFKELNNLCL